MMASMSRFTLLAWGAWCVLFVVWLGGQVVDGHPISVPRGARHLALQIPASMLLAVAFVLLLRPNTRGLNTQITPHDAVFGTLGLALGIGGIAFAIWARLVLGRNWSGMVMQVRDQHELIQTGPYALVRHPIYTGLLLGIFGTALTLGTLASYLGVAAGLVALLLRVEIEERLMAGEFGATHDDYRRRTRKLIPFVW
jgi:protein-S-isoprenylcysteine O-methyltransferase Ste14